MADRLAEVDAVSERLNTRFRENAAAMRTASAEADKLGRKFTEVRDKASLLGKQFTAVRREAGALETKFGTLRRRVDDLAQRMFILGREQKDLTESTVRLAAAVDGLRATAGDADAALVKLTVAANAAGDAMSRLAAKSVIAGAATRTVTRAFFGFWGILGLLRRDIPLFGGLLTKIFGGAAIAAVLGSVRAWHLALDLAAELVTVLLGAGIAMAALAVAGSDAAREIFHHFQNAHVVMDAFGKSIPPATGALEKLHEAVRPTIFQLLGDVISIVKAKAHEFAVVTLGAAREVQLLAARFTLAITSGAGFGALIKDAVPSLAALGALIGNVSGIFGALFRALPGYAVAVFTFLAAVAKVGEVIAQAAVPVLSLGLRLHGLWLYAGLAGTAVFFLTKGLIGMARWVGLAIGDILLWAAAAIGAAGATGLWASALAILDAVNPLFWLALAAGAITAFVIWADRGTKATDGWAKALNDALQNAKPLQIIPMLMHDTQVATDHLHASQARLAATAKYIDTVNLHTGQTIRAINPLWQQQADAVDRNAQIQSQFSGTLGLVTHRVGVLSGMFGGQSHAMGLATAAGITYKDLTDKSSGALAILIQRVKGTALGFEAMNIRGGELGNTLQVMDMQVSDQAQAVQKANQAWDTFIGNMTSAQQTFDTAVQGVQTLASAFKAAGKNGETVTVSIGKIHDKFALAKTSIDSLTKSGIALNQAFTTQISNLNSLFDSWRTAGLAQNLFIRGVKDAIQPMLKYAAGSQEATAQLVGLAEEAGFNGPSSMKALIKWIGNTHGSMKDLKKITNQATVQMALLTGAMNAQGDVIANKLLGDINNAILAYFNVTGKAEAYGKAVAAHGKSSDQAHKAALGLAEGLAASGRAAGDSAKKTEALINKLHILPKRVVIDIVEHGLGSFGIKEMRGGFPIGGGNRIRPASGGFIIGAGGPTDDAIPAMVSNGEYVIKASSVSQYGTGMMDMINAGAFADGGLIQTGNRDVLSGQFAISQTQRFIQSMIGAMEAAITAATRAAIRAARSAAMSFGAAGPGGGAPAANAALARSMFPGENFPAWNYVEMRESGWNQFARNPSSGAYGIPQALPPTKMPFAAQAAGGSNPAAQIGWMEGYMRSRYGGAAGAAAHESAFNWYNRGGPVRRYASGGGAGPPPGKGRNPTAEAIERMIKVFEHGGLANIIREVGTLLRDIKKQFGGGGRREQLVMAQLDHLKNIRARLGHIDARIQAARQYQQSVTSGLQSYADVGGLTVGGGYVGSAYKSGGQMLHLQLQQKLANLRKFARVLKRLAKGHVPAEIMREIINAGPDAGLQIAQEILAGGPELMKQLAGDEAALQKIEKQIGRGASSYVYTGQFKTGKDFLAGLEHEKAHLERGFRHLGRILGEEASKWFGVPGHHHHGHHGGGGHHHHGGSGGGPGGPGNNTSVVNIAPGGVVNIREPVDAKLLDQRVNFGLISAGLGG